MYHSLMYAGETSCEETYDSGEKPHSIVLCALVFLAGKTFEGTVKNGRYYSTTMCHYWDMSVK